MTKKDYQAIARAFHSSRIVDTGAEDDQWREDVGAIADVLSADSPRFDRECFVTACETGNVRARPKRKPLPLCVQAMRCYCAGHARGNPASEPCDTSE